MLQKLLLENILGVFFLERKPEFLNDHIHKITLNSKNLVRENLLKPATNESSG